MVSDFPGFASAFCFIYDRKLENLNRFIKVNRVQYSGRPRLIKKSTFILIIYSIISQFEVWTTKTFSLTSNALFQLSAGVKPIDTLLLLFILLNLTKL